MSESPRCTFPSVSALVACSFCGGGEWGGESGDERTCVDIYLEGVVLAYPHDGVMVYLVGDTVVCNDTTSATFLLHVGSMHSVMLGVQLQPLSHALHSTVLCW